MVLWMLGLLAFGADGDCTRVSWRHDTAQAAADEHTAEALEVLVGAVERKRASCPPSDWPPTCLEAGVDRARAGAVAFQLYVDAVDAAQEHRDVGTLLSQRQRALLGLAATADAAARAGVLGVTSSPSSAGLRDAEVILETVPGRLVLRTQAEAEVFRAEQVWLDSARDWNRARCDCDAMCLPPRTSLDRQLTRMRLLYSDLVQAQRDFLRDYSMQALTDRIVSGGAGEVSDKLLQARAAALQRTLSEHGARPHLARHRLAELLAHVDGHNERGPEAQRTLIAWGLFDRSWRSHQAKLDKRIDAVIQAWARVDSAESRSAKDVANRRLARAFQTIENTGPATPPSL